MKMLAYFVIVIGMAVLFYPTGKHFYEDYQQRKLLELWKEAGPSATAGVAGDANALEIASGRLSEALAAGENPESIARAASGKPDSPVWAVLQIDRIASKLPVLEGVSMQNMKYAGAHMSGTAKPGATGNSVIAAHHSYTYGRLFNRLGELQPGDEVKISYGGQTCTYLVTVKKTVEPDDLSVLNSDRKRKLLTLITCDENGSRRLIIQGELKS